MKYDRWSSSELNETPVEGSSFLDVAAHKRHTYPQQYVATFTCSHFSNLMKTWDDGKNPK